jgi:hypothetical protein
MDQQVMWGVVVQYILLLLQVMWGVVVSRSILVQQVLNRSIMGQQVLSRSIMGQQVMWGVVVFCTKDSKILQYHTLHNKMVVVVLLVLELVHSNMILHHILQSHLLMRVTMLMKHHQ